MRVNSDLERQFRENDKSLRTWATWKLKQRNMFNGSVDTSTWDRMSKHDQEFNLVWNEIQAKLFDVSLKRLKEVLVIVEKKVGK